MATVRVTNWPERDLEVTPEEEASLRSQGLILEPEPSTDGSKKKTPQEGSAE